MGGASKSGCDPWHLQAVTKVDTQRISLLHGFCRHVILAVSVIVIVLDTYWMLSDQVATVRGKYLPPSLEMLLSWSTLFRSKRTFSNYCGHVRTACLLCKTSTKVRSCELFVKSNIACHVLLVCEVFDDPALRRAKESIEKRGLFASRPRMFIQRHAQIVYSCVHLVLALAW